MRIKIKLSRVAVFALIFTFCWNVSAQDVNKKSDLTYEQRKLLSRMGSDMKAQEQLSQACQLFGAGKINSAKKVLREIEWWNTSIKINEKTADNDMEQGTLDYFARFTTHDKRSCNAYSSDLFKDAMN